MLLWFVCSDLLVGGVGAAVREFLLLIVLDAGPIEAVSGRTSSNNERSAASGRTGSKSDGVATTHDWQRERTGDTRLWRTGPPQVLVRPFVRFLLPFVSSCCRS